jgi:hypothetical protein
MAQRDRNKLDYVKHNAPKTMVAAITGAERGIDKDEDPDIAKNIVIGAKNTTVALQPDGN